MKICVYGDINPNVMDGSAIWMQSAVELLASDPSVEITLLLKVTLQRDVVLDRILGLPRVRVIDPWKTPAHAAQVAASTELSRNQALDLCEEIDQAAHFDYFLFRGKALCHRAAERKRGTFVKRMLSYLTDVPQTYETMTDVEHRTLDQIFDASAAVLCQTEDLRCFFEPAFPRHVGKFLLLPPSLPDIASTPQPESRVARLELVYAGKFAPAWNTLAAGRMVQALADDNQSIRLTYIGDKIHGRTPEHPGFGQEMEALLRAGGPIRWLGALSRSDVLRSLADYDLAVSWRDASLDDTLELSTKLIEYGRAGVPAVVNPTPMHLRLFGADYPYYAASPEDFERILRTAVPGSDEHARARARMLEVSGQFARERILPPLLDGLRRRRPMLRATLPPTQRRVGLVSHDFKFFGGIHEYLGRDAAVDIRVDHWEALARHDEAASRELLAWADTIVCEWCGPNAIWYSRNKRPGQRLVVRLHRFELYSSYPAEIDASQVDLFVFVDEHYRSEAVQRLGWDPAKLVTIPNYVDTELFHRSKWPGASFNLGMIGIAPSRKRLDRGVDIIDRLRRLDPRYRLYIKTRMPWDYWWIWKNPEEQAHYVGIFERLNGSAGLAPHVLFDPFGPDVAAWLRKIGFVLSTSDDESFHLAPAEGMASGAYPMLLDWPGARDVYPAEWVHRDEQDIAEHIHAIVMQTGTHPTAAPAELQAYIRDRYGLEPVGARWRDAILGDGAALKAG